MGLYSLLLHQLFTNLPVAIFPPRYPEPPVVPTLVTILDGLAKTNANVLFVVPSLLEVCLCLVSFMNINSNLHPSCGHTMLRQSIS
jgi:hypothetical protein